MKKSPFFLGFLIVIVAVVWYFNLRSGEPEVPVLDEQSLQSAVAVVDEVVDLGHKRKWREYAKHWVAVPKDESAKKSKKFFGKGYREHFTCKEGKYTDEKGTSMVLVGQFGKGPMGRVMLKNVEGRWLIKLAEAYF